MTTATNTEVQSHAQTKPRILCVDDEPNVLDGLTLNLRRRFDVATATSGAAGLAVMASDRKPMVIVSDMRMPGMDGAAFLARARELAPDSVRILLTGQADLSSAISAVNEGQIFRFLTKPCPPTALIPAVEAGVQQHRLVTAERVLLEQTLHGSIKALTDVLALTNPASFGRASRVKKHVSDIATRLSLPDRWQVEVAAMLSPIGLITLPPETAEKVFSGLALDETEAAMLAKSPAVTEQLLASIPRLENVRAILANYSGPKPFSAGGDPEKSALERACQVLRAAVEFDALESRGLSAAKALEALLARPGHDPEVLDALGEARGENQIVYDMKSLSVGALRVGMVLVDDLRLRSGVLVITRGFEITESFLERLLNFGPGAVQDPIQIMVRRAPPAA